MKKTILLPVAAVASLALFSVACSPEVKEFLLGPSAVATPAPAPVATPSPTPPPPVAPVAAAPEPTPWPTPPPEPGEDIPNNDAPVVKVGAKVFFVECDGVEMPDSENATEAPVGCRLHMDCTAKDAANQPTRAKRSPYWTLSNPELVTGGSRADYTPVFMIKSPGELTLHVDIDGVRSNAVTIRFQ